MENKNKQDRVKKLRLIKAKLKRIKRNAEFSVVIRNTAPKTRKRDVK